MYKSEADFREGARSLIEDRINELKNSQKLYGGVYIASISNFDNDEWVRDLEVELNEGTILFTMRVKILEGEEDCSVHYDWLSDELKSFGIDVYPRYAGFENAMGKAYEREGERETEYLSNQRRIIR